MTDKPDPGRSARELFESRGLDGVVHASGKAEACRRDGDGDGVRFWTAVVREMRRMAAAAADARPAGALWRLMQRVEHFRHQARRCEEQAAASAGAARAELLEIARHWLELAAYAELLAGENEPDAS
jgi:hypothetical protein